MNQSDLLKQWKRKKAADGGPARISPRPTTDGPARASAGQQRLFLLQRLYPGNRFYQYGHRYTLAGELDRVRLEAAFRSLLDRQRLLRAYFREEAPDQPLELHYRPAEAFQLETGPEAGFFQEEVALPGTVDRPLFRARLVRTGPDRHELLILLHHIIGDRGAFQLLEHELFATYARLGRGEEPPEPPVVQFEDYAHWEANRAIPAEHFEYWREKLAAPLPPPSLETDFPRPDRPSFRGELLTKTLGREAADRLRTLARNRNTTPNVVFLAALTALLYRYAGETDQLIGSPVSLRDRRELEGTIGFFNETVVLRNEVDPDGSFDQLVGRCAETMTAALERKDVPFDRLVSELRPDRRGGRPPFFQTMLVYNAPARPVRVNGLSVNGEAVDLGSAKFDLTLFVTDREDDFELTFEYATDLFTRVTVEQLLDYLRTLTEAAVTNPATSVATLELLDPATKETLRSRWFSEDPAPARRRQTAPERVAEIAALPDQISRWAKETPNATAVTDGSTSMSYVELLTMADSLAARLLRAGLRPGEPVGLYAGRETAALAGLLGIQRAGGAYLPLDPAYPAENLRYMGEDAGARFMVSTQAPSPGVVPDGCRVFPLERGSADGHVTLPEIDPTGNAYFIYTSGSSGRPKGVPITHANLTASTAARMAFYELPVTAYLLLSSFSFDSSVAGIFWTLASGGKLVLSATRAEQEPAKLGELIGREGISHTLMLPSLYQLLLEFSRPGNLAGLRKVIVAGEACPVQLITEHYQRLPHVRLVNEYGPTEATVWSTATFLGPDQTGNVPIGKPIPGMGNYVLDDRLQLVPPGRPGELFLSGPQIAAGYHNRPELTAERFLPNPYASPGHERLYRTGDLVRYRPDGHLDFLGRADAQVKIRGHRVELSGISAALRGLPEVDEAETLLAGKNGDRRLLAYVSGTPLPDGRQLRESLRGHLPAHVLPDRVIVLPALPRLPNGKIDRNALPTDLVSAEAIVPDYLAPGSQPEMEMADIWTRVLKHRPIGLNDDFFDLGGDSLRSIRIISLVNRETGLSMKPHHLFNYPVLGDLVRVLVEEGAAGGRSTDNVVPLKKGGGLPALFCLHSGGGHVFFYQPLAQALAGSDRPVYAIQPSGLDGGAEEVPGSIEEMSRTYIAEMRGVQPNGPYHLLGTCFSNMLILEMTRQLKAAGQEVGRLFVIDSGPGQLEKLPEVPARPLANLLKLIGSGNWYNVRSALRRRWWHLRRALGAPVRTEERQQVYETVDSLNDIYAKYERRPVHAPLTFIRSSEFSDHPQKGHHIPNWTQLAAAGLDIHVVPGTHLGLFAPPEVAGLAAKIDECLQERNDIAH